VHTDDKYVQWSNFGTVLYTHAAPSLAIFRSHLKTNLLGAAMTLA